MVGKQRFKIDLEFEVFGDKGVEHVVVTCPQLNVQTSGDTLQKAAARMGEAMVFFFNTAEYRYELTSIVKSLVSEEYPPPPLGLL